jgi:hypothetical protein
LRSPNITVRKSSNFCGTHPSDSNDDPINASTMPPIHRPGFSAQQANTRRATFRKHLSDCGLHLHVNSKSQVTFQERALEPTCRRKWVARLSSRLHARLGWWCTPSAGDSTLPLEVGERSSLQRCISAARCHGRTFPEKYCLPPVQNTCMCARRAYHLNATRVGVCVGGNQPWPDVAAMASISGVGPLGHARSFPKNSNSNHITYKPLNAARVE